MPTPAAKALWAIEAHLDDALTLDGLAQIAGVSPFHLTRAFSVATGQPVMRYLRGRRLSRAARALAGGAADILTLAVDAGYGSHEAFTRAFRDHFGLTPEAVRSRGHVNHLDLVEPYQMDNTPSIKLDAPRFVEGPALLLAGLSERYSAQTSAGIPAQWGRFVPHIGHVPGQTGRAAYGVLHNGDGEGNVDYLTAVEVTDFASLPAKWSRLRLAPQRYAVFTHHEHVSTIRTTWHAIWNQWLPESGVESVDAPDFERYGESFDGRTGLGGVEIWVPVKNA